MNGKLTEVLEWRGEEHYRIAAAVMQVLEKVANGKENAQQRTELTVTGEDRLDCLPEHFVRVSGKGKFSME